MLVSVVIPVRDGEAYLAATLRSLLCQTRPPAEVIVVDNGSRDRSCEIAESFGKAVTTISAAKGGASAARNAGAARADGEALMFLDADDLLGPTVLEELTEVLRDHARAVACCPWMRFELENDCWLARPASCAPRRPGQDHLAAWLTGWYHPPCSVLWSRAAYEASGGWDEDVMVNTDGDLMMRALIAGIPLVPTAGGTAYYRRLPGEAVSLSGRRKSRTGCESRFKVLNRIAQLLEDGGRLRRYRRPLAEAYDILAEDCGTSLPDLRARAKAAAQRHGGPRLLRRAVRRVDFATRRLRPDRLPTPLPAAARPATSADRSSPAAPDPLVSVVVPTYNRAALLPRAVRGALNQSYRHLELLIIDDASSDDTAAVVAEIGDPRVRYLRQAQNGGVAAARNRGLREAKGALIAFLDSDDEWMPNKLERQVDLMRRRPDKVALVHSGVLEHGADGDRIVHRPQHRGDVWHEMLHWNAVGSAASGVVIRREVVETVGLFDASLPAIEDYDYWTRVSRFYELDFVSEPLIVYHNEAQQGPAAQARRSRDFAANMAARRLFAQRYGPEAKRAGVRHLFLLESARREAQAPDGSALRAMRNLVLAARSRPGEPRIYFWLLFILLPRRLREPLAPSMKALRHRLPQRLWLGRV